MSKVFGRCAKGFTITEVLIATAITAFFVLLGASVVNQVTSFEKSVTNRLMDDFLIVNTHKVLVGDLEGSYWARLGIFECPSSKDLMTTDGDANVTLSADGSSIEFVKVDMASTVGLSPIVDTITVADANKLRVGDYILLNLASVMTEAGLFKVISVNQENRQVRIATATLDEEASTCNDTLTAKTLSSFFGPNIKSNVLLSRIIAVKYTLDKGILTRQTWPGKNQVEQVTDDVRQVSISGKWTSTADDLAGKKLYGRMSYKVGFDIQESTMSSNAAKYFKEKVLEARYNLNVFQIANIYSPIGAPSAAINFPTCAVNQEYKAGVLNLNPSLELYRNTISMKLTGSVSETVSAASINIAFSPSTGGTVQCFQHNPDDGVYPPASVGGMVNGPGVNGSVTLNQGMGGFDIYTCAVRGRVEVTASMSYFDNTLNQVKTINCTTEPIDAPTKYRFNNVKTPSCRKAVATWNMGSAFSGDSSDVFFGKFGVDMQTSCEWSGESYPDAENTGIAGNCYFGEHLMKTLRRVYLRPFKMNVLPKTGSTPVFPETGAYVDCN